MNRAPYVFAAILIASFTFVSSCEREERIVYVPREVPADCPPSAPRGVYAVNLEGYVLICWYPNPEEDVLGYDIWKNNEFFGTYDWIGEVDREVPDPDQYCFDHDTPFNQQFYYAVSAYDVNNNMSELSYEVVTATPRPEGFVRLDSRTMEPASSGYDFSSFSDTPQPWDAAGTDIWFEGGAANMFRTAMPRVMIQDYGYTPGFDDINRAPSEGFSPSGSVEAIQYHCYILRLGEADGVHYAKIWISSVDTTATEFWWAYQTDPENRDLSPGPDAGDAGGTPAAIDFPGLPAAVGAACIEDVPNGRRPRTMLRSRSRD